MHDHDPSSAAIVRGPIAGHERILTTAALAFLGRLIRRFRPGLDMLLDRRRGVAAAIDAGERPHQLAHTKEIRESDWTVAPIPHDLQDRRIEITGPVDAKMIINALGSGADVFMADFEDSSAPTWANMMGGQANLFDAVRRTLTFEDAARGKSYRLAADAKLATLFVRPRGLHLVERHIEVDGRPVPAALVDFGLFFFHNAAELIARGTGPYFYLPKMQSHLEARWYNEVFDWAQDTLGIPRGTIRATVLIETLPAAFEMHEILWELREHSAGLNCGRWDYIFSFIKTLRADPGAMMPDRALVTMAQPNMAAYAKGVVAACHRRRVHAMGGMAAQIPIKDDAARNEAAMARVRADKLREVQAGHDGTWVAHPGLIGIARAAFEEHLSRPNQIDRPIEDAVLDTAAMLKVPEGARTEAGLRHNIRVGVQYVEAWLRGNGCVPLYDLMEDAATAEISRTQVWQWLHHGAVLEGRPGGLRLDATAVRTILDQEMSQIRSEVGDARYESGRFPLARDLFESISTDRSLADFLTVVAYDHILSL